MAIKVMLADDHTILRAGLQGLLHASSNVEVIAQADNDQDTVSLARELEPGVIVVDVALPGMNGVGALSKGEI